MPVRGSRSEKRRGRDSSSNDINTTAQKVVIPKGIVNPHETTIIEIPARLHKQPIVVAKRKHIDGVETPVAATIDSTTVKPSSPVPNIRSNLSRPMPRSYSPQFNSTSKQAAHLGYSTSDYYATVQDVSADTNLDLDHKEEQERLQLQRDLEAFQRARRKLIEHASKFTSQPSHYL